MIAGILLAFHSLIDVIILRARVSGWAIAGALGSGCRCGRGWDIAWGSDCVWGWAIGIIRVRVYHGVIRGGYEGGITGRIVVGTPGRPQQAAAAVSWLAASATTASLPAASATTSAASATTASLLAASATTASVRSNATHPEIRGAEVMSWSIPRTSTTKDIDSKIGIPRVPRGIPLIRKAQPLDSTSRFPYLD